MNALVSTIRAEQEKAGALSLARFMELALYTPALGYYERADRVGQGGDFFTSVSVGSLFGELLAWQLSRWTEESIIGTVHFVESGAHDCKLARDILAWMTEERPQLARRLEYWILEPSPQRQQWQKSTLAQISIPVRWFSSWAEVPPVRGVIFSNELLDAMPLHRLGWDARKRAWFEWGVGWDGTRFVWQPLASPTVAPSQLPVVTEALGAVLPHGFSTEISPAAQQWWHQAARALQQGKLLAIDYGLVEEEFFQPHRQEGTLRAYHKHHLKTDVLDLPGEQDITAQVNWSSLQGEGEKAGLHTRDLVSQTTFFTRIAAETWKEPHTFGPWTRARVKQFQTLTHPEHLGRPFKLLIQEVRGESRAGESDPERTGKEK